MTAALQRRAAVDVGTHSVRYLVADGGYDHDPGRDLLFWHEIERGRIGARLGEGWREGDNLAPEAAERAIEAVRHAAERLRALGAVRIEAVATGVVREARDGEAFVERLRRETGLPVRLISGDEEAALSFRGAAAGLMARSAASPTSGGKDADASKGVRLLVVDIGGGSTEWIVGRIDGAVWLPGNLWVGPYKLHIKNRRSLPLGAERLTKAFVQGDPPLDSGWDELLAHVATVWGDGGPGSTPGEGKAEAPAWAGSTVVVGGTVTTIAAIDAGLADYDRDRLHGYTLTREAVRGWAERLAAASRSERLAIPGLPPERVDIIPAGAAILQAVMDLAALPSVEVGQWDMLEGLIYP